jgi:hypothetical protein
VRRREREGWAARERQREGERRGGSGLLKRERETGKREKEGGRNGGRLWMIGNEI